MLSRDAVGAGEAGVASSSRWVILTALAVGTIMGPLDSSVVNIALPQIQAAFGVDLAAVEWVSMIYLFVISSLLLTFGRVGDLYGHRSVYLAGFTVFTAGSLLCSIAPSLPVLLVSRGIQAVGASMLMAAGPAILTEVFPPRERGQALGLNAMVVAVGLAMGPIAGGYLVDHLGWRAIFYINLPIGLLGTAWASRVLPKVAPAAASEGGLHQRTRFDYGGATLLAIALGALLLAISQGQNWSWGSMPVIGLLVGGVLSLVLFVHTERQNPASLVDLSLFRQRLFAAANASALLNYLTQYMVTFLMPFYLQNLLGLPPSRAGELLIAYPLAVMLVAPLAGWLSDRIGSLYLAATGMGVMSLAALCLSQLNAAATASDVLWRLSLFGIGSGLFQSPNNNAIMGSVPRPRLGQASGMLATMRNMGMVLGIAVSGATFSGRLAVHLRDLGVAHVAQDVAAADILRRQAFVMSLHDTFLVAAALAAFGVVTSLVRGRSLPQPGQRSRIEAR
ncbi:MAG: MFS transporter [Limnochordales bacterium]|nr:MFS transporter [Limnochordales bacterium]